MNESGTDMPNSGRRTFLLKVLALFGSVVGIVVSIPVLGSILSPLIRKKPETWRSVGRVDDFTIGETVLVQFRNASPEPWAGITSLTASWLRRVSEDEFIAFSINCTHLGCPVRWVAEAELFLCPCHGGVYYKDGSYAAGPPPKNLYRYPVRIRNNHVEIEAAPIPVTT